jgi:6-pyruvoyltetrahydropterin/6-carboxytetrahydropterin synthase
MRLQTEFTFDAAHRLVGYEGNCSRLHGHIWRVVIELQPFNDSNVLDEVGMLWDFTNAKRYKEIFDHKTLLKECKENDSLAKAIVETCGDDSILMCDENPTAEYLSDVIAEDIIKRSEWDCLAIVTVYESPKSFIVTEKWGRKEENDTNDTNKITSC